MTTLGVSVLGLACAASVLAASPAAPRAGTVHPDHLILGTRDLEEGMRQFEEKTGVRPMVGGEHPGRGTRNALASLGRGLYVEILAPQVAAPDSDAIRDLRQLSDLTPLGWAAFVPDVADARRRLEAAGLSLSDVRPGSRARPDGRLLEWTTFETTAPAIAGMPFFIRWGDGTTHPSQDAPAGCGVQRLRVVTPDAAAMKRAFAALDLDVAVEPGPRAGLDLWFACPKGPVRFAGDFAPGRP
jgi:hypothetical protein